MWGKWANRLHSHSFCYGQAVLRIESIGNENNINAKASIFLIINRGG